MNRNACRRFNETISTDSRVPVSRFCSSNKEHSWDPLMWGSPIALSADLPSRVTRIDRLKTDIYKQHTMPRYVHRIIHSAWLWLHDLSKNRLAKSDAYISRERVVKNREKITSSSFSRRSNEFEAWNNERRYSSYSRIRLCSRNCNYLYRYR